MIARLLWANGRIEETQVTAEVARRAVYTTRAPRSPLYCDDVSPHLCSDTCPTSLALVVFRRKPEMPAVGVVEFEEVPSWATPGA